MEEFKEVYPNAHDALGDYWETAKRLEGGIKTKDPDIRRQGYTVTEIWLFEGKKYTLHKNPNTGECTGRHFSSFQPGE